MASTIDPSFCQYNDFSADLNTLRCALRADHFPSEQLYYHLDYYCVLYL
jgi:hypothetical protein